MQIEINRELASVAQLVGVLSCNQKFAGSIPDHSTWLDCRFDPWSKHIGEKMGGKQGLSLSRPLSLPLSLKNNETISFDEDKKVNKMEAEVAILISDK